MGRASLTMATPQKNREPESSRTTSRDIMRFAQHHQNVLGQVPRIVSAAFALFIGLSPPHVSEAQTLDEAIQSLLGSDCAGLRSTPGSSPITGLSTELNSICEGNGGLASGGGSGVSSGGGSGAVQSLTVTVDNRRKARLGGFNGEKITEVGRGRNVNVNLGEGAKLSFFAPDKFFAIDMVGLASRGMPSFSGNMGSGANGEFSVTNPLIKGLGLFVSFNIESLDRDVTTFADGFTSTLTGTTVGGDYLWSDQFLSGGAFTFTNTNGDFDGGGDFSTNSYQFVIYGSFLPMSGAFADVAVGFTAHDYSVDRSVSFVESTSGTTLSGTASNDSDGREINVHALFGYDHAVGSVTIGPRAGLNYTHLFIDGYSETGGGGLALVFDDQDVTSFQSVLGIQGSMTVNTSYGVWVPQANADYVHEFENDQRLITVKFAGDGRATPTKFSFQNDTPVRNFFNFGLGTVLVLPHGIQPYVNFRAMVGNEQFSNFVGTFGVRIEGGR